MLVAKRKKLDKNLQYVIGLKYALSLSVVSD